jgi:hypothetical protein
VLLRWLQRTLNFFIRKLESFAPACLVL